MSSWLRENSFDQISKHLTLQRTLSTISLSWLNFTLPFLVDIFSKINSTLSEPWDTYTKIPKNKSKNTYLFKTQDSTIHVSIYSVLDNNLIITISCRQIILNPISRYRLRVGGQWHLHAKKKLTKGYLVCIQPTIIQLLWATMWQTENVTIVL